MISGILHQGSGLGNQLMRYVMTRCLAEDKGYEWGMLNPELFKGKDFMSLDMGKPVNPRGMNYFEELRTNTEWGTDIRGFDDNISMIKDNTIIDGEFQHFRYWGHRLDEIREWLKPVKWTSREIPPNTCVINFRGGEYTAFPDLFLTPEYWYRAVEHMEKRFPNIDRFEIHTDDVKTALRFFPDESKFRVLSNVTGMNYHAVLTAPYLILSNSSFGIFPAILNQKVEAVIAPKYWARHNVSDGYWATFQNIYPNWWYMDTEGNLEQSYDIVRD